LTLRGSFFASCSLRFKALSEEIWGRKRHALVDTQGNLLEVKVTGAEKSDQEGGRTLLAPLKEWLPRDPR
jgi:hypothetical protein